MVKSYFINPFNDQFQNMLPAVLNIITPIPNISGWRISFESGFWSTSFRPQPITSIHKHPGLSLEKSSHFFTLSFIKSHKKKIFKKSLMKDCNNFEYAVIVTRTKLVWLLLHSTNMSYADRKERVFRYGEPFDIPHSRSESRMKRYWSATDRRAWCDEVELRRKHILELNARSKGVNPFPFWLSPI